MTTEEQISKVREERDEARQQYADRGERESRGARGEATSRADGRELSNRGRSSRRCGGVFSRLKSAAYHRWASHLCCTARFCDLEKDLGS